MNQVSGTLLELGDKRSSTGGNTVRSESTREFYGDPQTLNMRLSPPHELVKI